MNKLEALIQDYMGWINKEKLPFKAADVLLMDYYEHLSFRQVLFLNEFLRRWQLTFKQELGRGVF